MPLVLVVIALELEAVAGDMPLFFVGLAYAKLLRLWGSMRFDDTRGMLPSLMHQTDRGLEAKLERTKTSGPGKKQRWLHVFVASGCFVADQRWQHAAAALLRD